MRLLSAVVRNYRVHREVRLEFAPGLNLICGPNESGKSTLAEAIHRALFLKARGNTAAHERMRSTLYPGTPEVTLRFEQHGKICVLTKQFTRGTLLEVAGKPARRDAEAEEYLAELLHSGAAVQGGGVDAKLQLRWAHLWAWQGKSGSDPAETAREQAAELVRCLQQLGGGAVVSSPLDARLLARFRKAVEETFVQRRGYRAGSPAASAQEALAQAEAALERAEATLRETEAFAADFEAAARALAEAVPQVRDLEKDLNEAQERQQTAQQLANQCREATQARKAAETELERLLAAAAAIDTARKRVRALEAAIREKTEAAEQQKQKASQARQEADALLARIPPTREASLLARKRVDACAAAVELLQRQALLDGLDADLRRVAEWEKTRLAYDEELSGLPAMSRKHLEELRRLRETLREAEARLEATSARLELLAATVPVAVDGKPLPVGSGVTLTDAAEVTVGEAAKLRLTPGGGHTIAEAKDAVEAARTALTGALAKRGVASVEDAEALAGRIAELTAGRQAIARALESLQPDELREKRGHALQALSQARASLDLLAAGLPGFAPAETREGAVAALEEARAVWREADGRCVEAETRATEQNDLARNLAEEAARAVDAASKARAELDAAEGTLRGLEEAYGDDEELRRKTAEARQRTETADRTVAELDARLAALQPDLVAQDVERLQRSLENLRSQISVWKTRQQVALSHLQSAGTSDPRADAAMARQARDRAAARFRELAAQAAALRRLADLFEEEQARAWAAIAAPLNDRVNAYIRCLFGPDASARFELEPDGTLGRLLVSREGANLGTFEFEVLSSGAREQIGVAVRLAMAQVLAASHGGCLPVVLDDAFANSDPERVRELQRMLDLAAAKGLQIIVLTCNPNDYRALGAAMTTELAPPERRAGPPDTVPPPAPTAGNPAWARDKPPEADPLGQPIPGERSNPVPGGAAQDAVLALVRSRPGVSRGDVARELGLDDQEASRHLEQLLRSGLVRREGQKRGTRYFGTT